MRKEKINPYVLTGEALLALAVLYGCSIATIPVEIDIPPSIQPKPEETMPLPADTASPTDAATVEGTGTLAAGAEIMMATNTGTPEFPVGPFCGLPEARTEIADNFLAYETLVTLSEGTFRQAIGSADPEVVNTVLVDATNRISALADYYARYPNFGINRIVIPADIEPADVERAIGQDLKVIKYTTGIDLSDPGTALTAIHVGIDSGGWEVFVWTNGPNAGSRLGISDRTDSTKRINGLIHAWTTTADGRLVLAEVPGQLLNGHADIAIFDGCEPQIVRLDSADQVLGIFDSGEPFITADNKVNTGADTWFTSDELALTVDNSTPTEIPLLPEGLQKLVPPGGFVKSEIGENGINWMVIFDADGNELYLIDKETLDTAEQFAGILAEGSVISTSKDVDGQEWINVENDGQTIFRLNPEVSAGENGSFPAQILLDGKWVEAILTKNEGAGLTARVNSENGWNFEWINGEWRWKAPEFIVLPDTLEEVLVMDGNWEEVLAQVQPAEEYSLQNRLFYRATAEGVISEGKDLQLIPYGPEKIEYADILQGRAFVFNRRQENFDSKRSIWTVSAFKVNLTQGDFLVIGVAMGEPGITPDITAEKIIHVAIDISEGAWGPTIVDMNKQKAAWDTVENLFALFSSRSYLLYDFYLLYSGNLQYTGPDMRALQTQAQPVIREWYNTRIMPDEAQKILFPANSFFIKK